MYSIKEVMESKNIAIFGVSGNPDKPGTMLLKFLKETGFKGKVAGINPKGGRMYGVDFYFSLDEVPFQVDLAVMIIPPKAVLDGLKDCARSNVKGVVISTEGFAEAGGIGVEYQNEALGILSASGMRAFGPNTLGIVNTATGLSTSYIADKRILEPGNIGFAAQSGIFVGAFLRYLTSFKGLKISKGLGLGNKVDVDESDALSYLAEDESTKAIGMYIEDVRDGQRFCDVAVKAVKKKPVALLKGGRTPLGARSTSSHTASLAMNDRVAKGVFRQMGILRVASIDELLGTLKGFCWMPLPKGPNIALVTYSGAQAIMSIDAATESGLALAKFKSETREALSTVISSSSKTRNPVDMFPDMSARGFEKTTTRILKSLLEDEGVDGIVFISFGFPANKDFQPLMEIIKRYNKKPVFFSLLGPREEVEANKEFIEAHGVPFYLFPETAIRVFSNMRSYAAIRDYI